MHGEKQNKNKKKNLINSELLKKWNISLIDIVENAVRIPINKLHSVNLLLRLGIISNENKETKRNIQPYKRCLEGSVIIK